MLTRLPTCRLCNPRDLCAAGRGGLFLRHPSAHQCRAARENRASDDPTRGASVANEGQAPIRGFRVSGAELGQASPCHRQDQMASGRVIPKDWLHRHQPAHGAGSGGAVLQNQRGTAEQHIKEGKYAFHWTRLSCRRFRDNEVRLQLHAGLQPGDLPALHRAARGDGRLVADQPPAQADQDRGPRRASRPRHHLPAGRGRGHRPDGQGHSRRHTPIASATVMRVTAIQAQTEQKRRDSSVRHAEKRRCRARMTRLCGPIHPHSSVPLTADQAWSANHLIWRQNQATLQSSGKPLGECRSNYTNAALVEGQVHGVSFNCCSRLQ